MSLVLKNADSYPSDNEGPDTANTRRDAGLAVELAEQLDESGIDYCVWKGTFSADRAYCGETDIDVLVKQSDVAALQRVLAQLRFKPTSGESLERLPGTTDFFGYDQREGTLLHVHVHEKIVLGHPLRHTWHLPLEQAFLETSRKGPQFRFAEAELEFIVFCLRRVLERGFAVNRDDRRREFEYLRERVDDERLEELLAECFPFLHRTLFQELSVDSPGNVHRLRLELIGQLDRFYRPQDLQRRASLFWHRIRRAIRVRLFRLPPRKQRLVSGGTVVAVVGGDGAGKSTTIKHLKGWLARDFDVSTFHLGRPRKSLATKCIRGSLKVVRAIARPLQWIRRNEKRPLLEFSRLAWFFCIARDRYRTYIQLRRRAADGEIIICDRWPLPHIMSMDGPQIIREACNEPTRMIRWMSKWERHWHDVFSEPDLLLVLRLEPEIAVSRKPEEEPGFVHPRAFEVWNASFTDTRAVIVDTSQPIESVVSKVKEHFWHSI